MSCKDDLAENGVKPGRMSGCSSDNGPSPVRWAGATFEDGIYRREYVLRSQDVGPTRRLKTSRLLELLQEAAIAHTEQLGMGREHTLDQGILWVVTQQHLELASWPLYDQDIIVESWPGAQMHVLFPRQFRVLDALTGAVLVRASSIWMLIDAQSRRMAFPDRFGVHIDGVARDDVDDFALPRPVAAWTDKHGQAAQECRCEQEPGSGAGTSQEGSQERVWQVPFSACDLNGHLNNTRYLDLVEDAIRILQQGREPVSLTCEYAAEAPLGERLLLRWEEQEKSARFESVRLSDRRSCFRCKVGR